jgi:hypothetical protein
MEQVFFLFSFYLPGGTHIYIYVRHLNLFCNDNIYAIRISYYCSSFLLVFVKAVSKSNDYKISRSNLLN